MARNQQVEARNAWDRIAEGYDRFVTPSGNMDLAEESLRRAGLRRGMNVLDVAAGSGALSLPAARMGAQVTAVDISPSMIRQLEIRAQDDGLENLRGLVMDGQALTLEENSFDISASQFGVMLFPDLPRGISELVRVTKPGGRVVVVAFGPPSKVEFLSLFVSTVKACIPGFTGLPTDPPPLPFQVADPRVLHQKMADAGLREIHVEPYSHLLAFRSGQEMWDWVTNSNPIGALLVADASGEQRNEILRELDDALRQRSNASELAILKNHVNIAVGVK